MATKINRDKFLKFLTTVGPAVSKQNYIPALSHVLFKDGFAAAYDDVLAITVATGLDLDVLLPGDTLIRTLSSFNADTVSIDLNENNEVKVSSGRSHVKMVSMQSKSFPLVMPSGKKGQVVDIDDDFITGVRALLPAVGNNPSAPASLGITIELDGAAVMLYATDGNTITRYHWANAEGLKVELEQENPVLLPTKFCEQLVSLYKANPKCDAALSFHSGSVTCEFFDDDGLAAKLFTKTMSDLALFNYAELLAKYVKQSEVEKITFPIPDGLDSAIDRACLVLTSNVDKVAKLTPTDDGFKLYTVGELGEASDSVEVKGKIVIDDPIHIDPVLIGRACKMSTAMALYSRVVVFTNKRLLHVVSTCSAGKKG